jgi:hypothetical protein
LELTKDKAWLVKVTNAWGCFELTDGELGRQ